VCDSLSPASPQRYTSADNFESRYYVARYSNSARRVNNNFAVGDARSGGPAGGGALFPLYRARWTNSRLLSPSISRSRSRSLRGIRQLVAAAEHSYVCRTTARVVISVSRPSPRYFARGRRSRCCARVNSRTKCYSTNIPGDEYEQRAAALLREGLEPVEAIRKSSAELLR